MSDLLKKVSNSLICSFLVSNLRDSLTSLIKKEGMSESYQENTILVKFF